MLIAEDMLPKVLSGGQALQDWEASSSLGYYETVLRRDAAIPSEPDAVFVLLEGWACGYKILRDGERQICSIHVAGDGPDFRKLFLPAAELEFRTLTPCRTGIISAAGLRELCRQSDTVANAVVKHIAVSAAISEEWIANIGRRRAINRVAHLICELACRLDAARGASQSRYAIPLTQADLGDATGLSTVHVNRVLQELRARGLVEFAAGQLVIPDRRQLAQLAGFDPRYLHLALPHVNFA